jgi:hypothetical protein
VHPRFSLLARFLALEVSHPHFSPSVRSGHHYGHGKVAAEREAAADRPRQAVQHFRRPAHDDEIGVLSAPLG